MHKYWWCAILFRIILPLTTAAAIYIRPTITSYIYMIMGCYMPFFSVPTITTMKQATGTYMKILLITCILISTMTGSFYFALFFFSEDEVELEPCSTLEKAIRTLGIVDFATLNVRDAIPWCLPEPLMLGVSSLLYLAFKKMCQDTKIVRATAIMNEEDEDKDETSRRKLVRMMLNFGKYWVVFLMCLTAVLKTSVFGGIYYLFFLAVITYWACNQYLGKVFARLLTSLIPITFLNMTIIFCYQFQYLHDSDTIESESIWGRLFNLLEITTYKDCVDPRIFVLHAKTDSTYAVPVSLFFLYYSTVLVSREILQAKDGFLNVFAAICRKSSAHPIARERWHMAAGKIIMKQSAPDMTTADKVESAIENLLQLLIDVSYLTANFIMMIWGIAYVSWKAMLLLLWANLIWLLPFRKKVMLVSSPFIAVWVWFLLITNYLYSMDLTEEELPREIGIVDFSSGLVTESSRMWLHLLTKSLFGVLIFVTMRQLFQDRSYKKHRKLLAEALGLTEEEAGETLASTQPKPEFLSRLQNISYYFFATWWIWMVIILMIWMDFWGRSSSFRIVFVALAMVFLMTFQLCPFSCWKKFLKVYWWVVIIYSMFNLFVLYMYQIPVTRKVFYKLIPKENFKAYGFHVWKDRKELFAALANPIFFQIAVVIQKNYLQAEFDKITSPRPPEEIIPDEQKTKWQKFNTKFTNAKNVTFAILELHMHKIILLVGWFMCIFDLCALFVPFVLLFTACCIFGGIFINIVAYTVSCLVQILIVLRLMYMNMYTEHDKWNYIGQYERHGLSYNKTLNTASWIGFHKSTKGMEYADFWQLHWCFVYIFAVTVMRIVTIRMDNYRRPRNLETPNLRTLVLFPDINYKNCHESTSGFMKFLVNYGFYKFGVEISLFFSTVVMTMRMDILSIVYSIILLAVYSLNRKAMRIVWLPILVLMAIAVPAQYLSTLGYWPTEWNSSLTRFWTSKDYLIRIQQFCYLANMAFPPDKRKISFSFWYLLFLSRQWRAFKIEKKARGQYHPAGSNDNVSYLVDVDELENPVPDFITYTRSSLDKLKRIFFTMWFYAALISTSLAGVMRPTIYSLGYLVGASIFIWEGTHIFLRPPEMILRRWNMLIGYNVVVMLIRTVNQIFGCILIHEIVSDCMIFKIFSIGCVDKFGLTAGVPNISENTACRALYASLGLAYDCICFFFLIFQQRIFKTYHFFHMVNDIKAQTILSNRGAELIVEQKRKKRQAIDLQDKTIRENIEKKLAKVRATHQRVHGNAYARKKTNQSYILKSSDYYMFDDAILNNDIPLRPETKQNVSKSDPYDPMPLTEYLKLFHDTDVATVLEKRDLRRRKRKLMQQGKNPRAVKTSPGPSTSNIRKDSRKTRKFLNIFLFIWGIFESLIVSTTLFFNERSKDFREILNEINAEKKILKEHSKYARGVRLGTNKVWSPVQDYRDLILARRDDKVEEQHDYQDSIYFNFISATWLLILSHTELLSYCIIIFNQYKRANFISLPMVILVFCWGTLTVPKPTKTFWVSTISYVLIMLFIKNFFVMDIIPWETNTHMSNLFFPPLIIGLNRYASLHINIFILVLLFLHRKVLQTLGLWKPYDYRIATLVDNGEYTLGDQKLVPLPVKDTTTKNPFVLETVEASFGDYFPNSIVPGFAKYAERLRLFAQQLIVPSFTQIPVDVYTPMFLCDLINLLIIIFFYGSFYKAESDEGFINFIQNNDVPISFLVVVLLYFLAMVIDRAIYLKKSRLNKIFYHFFQVIAVHIYFFILYPIITERIFIKTPVVQAFYIFKCFYFLLSTYQIKNGYPALISGHYLWHGTGTLRRFSYKIYNCIPYFFVMRTLLDWICTDSCLGVGDWFTMEDISQNIYENMCCTQTLEVPDSKQHTRSRKYLLGGFLYVLLVFTLIFPFMLFSLGSTVGVATHPTKFKIEVYMGSAEPLFQSHTSEKTVQRLSQNNYINLTTTFNNIKESEAIFGNFMAEDVVVVKWSPHSLTQWKVSPGTHDELMKDLKSKNSITIRVEIQYTHVGHGGEKTQSSFVQNTEIPRLPNKQRQSLIDILNFENKTTFLRLPMVFPKFMLITKDAKSKVLGIIKEPTTIDTTSTSERSDDYISARSSQEEYFVAKSFEHDEDEEILPNPSLFRNLLISLKTGKNREVWWHMQEECDITDDDYFYYLKNIQHNSCDQLVMYTFNEKVFSKTISYITQSGIIGLYLLYFMIMVDFMRGCRVTVDAIWINDWPDPEGLWRKCREVYIARDMRNYELEEELFAELIFIMRSREVLIKLTRETTSAYNPPVLTGESKKTK